MKFLTNANLTGNEFENVKRIQFTTSSGGQTAQPGALYWSPADQTLSLGTANGSSIEIGQENVLPIMNQTGSVIPDGSVVGYDGALGASGIIKGKLYTANGAEPAEYLLGIATHDILNGEIGHVATFGKLRGLNTTGTPYGETWVAGDILWAHPTVPGGLTKVKPIAPNLKINMAAVTSVHATQGSIVIRATYGSYLGDNHNSHIANLANNDILVYNSGNSRWENTPVKTINGENIFGAGDIELGGGSSSIMIENKSATTLGSVTNTVAIGIPNFSVSTHSLTVFANSTYISDYTITGTNIVKNSGTWDSGTVFNFISYTIGELPDGTETTTVKRQEFTATSGQTVFNLTNGGYSPGLNLIRVYLNGIRQPNTAYAETNSTRITMVSGVNAGDKVLCEWYETLLLPVANAATADHRHDSDYAAINHNHDNSYATISHNHDLAYADIAHNHDSTYLALAGGILTGPLTAKQIIEKFTKSTSAWSGTVNLDIKTTSGFYNTANATANMTLNFRGDGSTTLNNLIADGELVTVTVLITNGATPYYPTAYQIDGSPITVKWADGSAPTSGNASSIDAYTFAFIDTGGSQPVCLGSRTKFA